MKEWSKITLFVDGVEERVDEGVSLERVEK